MQNVPLSVLEACPYTFDEIFSTDSTRKLRVGTPSRLLFQPQSAGFLVISQHKPAQVPSFKTLKPTLAQDLMEELREMKIKIYLSRLQKKASILDTDSQQVV